MGEVGWRRGGYVSRIRIGWGYVDIKKVDVGWAMLVGML